MLGIILTLLGLILSTVLGMITVYYGQQNMKSAERLFLTLTTISVMLMVSGVVMVMNY